MKLLIDQNVRYRAVLALRQAGYDVIHTSEIDLSTSDDELILNQAIKTHRILITFDDDFGDYKAAPLPKNHAGVIRLKLTPQKWEWVVERLTQFLRTTNEEELKNKLVILYNSRVRVR